jgi:hypothetical protein
MSEIVEDHHQVGFLAADQRIDVFLNGPDPRSVAGDSIVFRKLVGFPHSHYLLARIAGIKGGSAERKAGENRRKNLSFKRSLFPFLAGALLVIIGICGVCLGYADGLSVAAGVALICFSLVVLDGGVLLIVSYLMAVANL